MMIGEGGGSSIEHQLQREGHLLKHEISRFARNDKEGGLETFLFVNLQGWS